MKLRPWLEGAGLALLYLGPHVALILGPGSHVVYHQLLPMTTELRGLMLDLIVLTVLCGAAFRWLQRDTTRLRDWLELCVFSAIGWIAGRILVFSTREPQMMTILRPMVPALSYLWIVLPLAAAIVLVFAPRLFRRAVAGVYVLLAAVGFACLIVVIPRLVFGSFSGGHREVSRFDHTPADVSASVPQGPRVIWLLFDEMSYDVAFDHRPADLHMPAFDRLAAESTYFSNVQPAGFYTERVIPSLFRGEFFPVIRIGKQGALNWHSASTNSWNAFDPQETVFGEAKRLGWTTGVAGWFNQYCRILGPVLDRCASVNRYELEEEFFPHLTTRQSSLENALYGLPFGYSLLTHFNHESETQLHREDYDETLAQAESLIQDSSIRFAFIHLPVPHLPGIYRRPESTSVHTSDYLDNMALADQALAQLRAAIAATPQAADTILIVCSDHSWRTQLTRGGPEWTKEEEQASHGGQFDQRPVLIVHYPGQTRPDPVNASVNLMTLHTLLLDMLQGKIDSVATLEKVVHVGENR
jgi:hypothetical protein